MTVTVEDGALDEVPTAELTARRSVTSAALAVVAILLLSVVLDLASVSRLTHRAAQSAGFATLRSELAHGTAPVSQLDGDGQLLADGAPVAILNIPQLGLHDEVVFNGTTSAVLTKGPGHERDTVLPGQAGQSVLFGRAAAFGGPFGKIDRLRVGDRFTVTTGQGVATYSVLDRRTAGDPSPSLAVGHGLLTLTTARGAAFAPSGVLRVDAALVSTVQPTPPLVALGPLSSAERPMAGERSALLPLVLWLQAALLVALGAVFAWYHWGRWQTWLAFGPLACYVGLCTADQIGLLLPNLI